MGFLFGSGGIFSNTPALYNSGGVISIDNNLGNIALIGNSPRAVSSVMRNYSIDALNNNKAVVVLRNSANGFSAYPTVMSTRRTMHEIDVCEQQSAEQYDGLAGYSDKEKETAIIQLMEVFGSIEPSKKVRYQNYISIIRSLLATRGKKLRLNELYLYNVDEVETLNATARISDAERMRNERFLSSFRTDLIEFETYCFEFERNITGHIMSGTKSLEDIFASKQLIEFSFDFKSNKDDSNVLLKAVVNSLCKFNAAAAGKNGLVVVINEIPNESLISAEVQRLIKNLPGCRVVYSIADISKLVEESNDWIEYADSYFFLLQTSDKNKEFSSAFFGTYEKQKVTTNTGRSDPTFWDRLANRGSSSRTSGTSVTTEKERVYLPEVFSTMPPNEAIYFFKSSNSHNRITLF